MYRCENIICNLDPSRDNLVCEDCHDQAISPSRVDLEVDVDMLSLSLCVYVCGCGRVCMRGW